MPAVNLGATLGLGLEVLLCAGYLGTANALQVVDVVAVTVSNGRLGDEAAARAGVGPQVVEGFEMFPVELVELGFRLAVEEPPVVAVDVVRAGLPAVEAADRYPESKCRLYLAPFRWRLCELAA